MTKDKNGYLALQVGAGKVKTKNLSKPLRGHFAKANVEPKQVLKEFTVSEDMLLSVGDTFSPSHYTIGQKVHVSGTSIGKGFSGAMKRHNFSGLEATHGVSISHRSHGSTGNSQDPGRVWKGKKMAGQYGNVNKTIQGLTIVDIDNEDDLIFVKGSVPGPKNSFVVIKDALKSKLPDETPKPAGLKTTKSQNEMSEKKNEFDLKKNVQNEKKDSSSNELDGKKIDEIELTEQDESVDQKDK